MRETINRFSGERKTPETLSRNGGMETSAAGEEKEPSYHIGGMS